MLEIASKARKQSASMRQLTIIFLFACFLFVYSTDPDFFDENGEFLSDTGAALVQIFFAADFIFVLWSDNRPRR